MASLIALLAALLALNAPHVMADEGPGICPHGGHMTTAAEGPTIDPTGARATTDQGSMIDPDGHTSR
jgi:hypothetical protein